MSKIIQFKGNEEEQHSCPTCDLILEHMAYVMDAESTEELFDALSELVQDAKDLGLKEYLVHELNTKVALLDHLEYGCCEEDCDCEE
jgi:hypothetical protein